MNMNWNDLLSTARFSSESSLSEELMDQYRDQWHRDHDRIIFSGAFRRLAVKTQVHSLPENDHVHTRLSHSLEVASVGRSLGSRLGCWMIDQGFLAESHTANGIGILVQSACLAHDIGNPPFGHAGEQSIRNFFEKNKFYLEGLTVCEGLDFTGFEGNAQGLRVLTALERHWLNGGMRLTASTLGTFIKYPFTSESVVALHKGKHGVNQAELPFMRILADELGLLRKTDDSWARHPLVYAVEAADDICYALIDLEDAVELGHLNYKEVSILMTELVDQGAKPQFYRQFLEEPGLKLEVLRSAAIDALIHEAEKRFIAHYEALMTGQFDEDLLDWRRASAGEVIQRAKELARERVYVDYNEKTNAVRSGQLLTGVLTHLIDGAEAFYKASGTENKIGAKARDAINRLGKFRPKLEDSKYQRLLKVTDYVSAMTDRYLTRLTTDLKRIGYLDDSSV